MNETRTRGRWIRPLLSLLLYSMAGAVGVMAGRFVVQETPDVRQLEGFVPAASTKVYAADGTLLSKFAVEYRTPVPILEIPNHVVQAVVATEDSRFYQHKGVDVIGIARAALANAKAGRIVEGGSTLTQQLAKMLFLHPKQTYERKAKEALLSVQIERSFTKQEILELYLNQVNMGHGQYGIEAAARFYFGKPAKELTLAEGAVLVGIPQRPSYYSPIRNPEAVVTRRNHVLQRMVAEEYITPEAAAEAMESPLTLAPRRSVSRTPAAYFVEEVRRTLMARYGDELLYRGGLEVYTTLDPEMQTHAEEAVVGHLVEWDRQRRFRGIDRNVLKEGELVEEYEDPTWRLPVVEGVAVNGLVVEIGSSGAILRIGDWVALADRESVQWTGMRPDEVFRRGDLARFRVKELLPEDMALKVELEVPPRIQGALVAIDVPTGAVKALVGGYDYELSEFNRATQAYRQTGSAFKPIYYAAALEKGWNPGTMLLDEPTIFLFPITRETYKPQNYYKSYNGLVTLRTSLEKSLNVTSVRLLNDLGYDTAIDYAEKMGIRRHVLPPYPSLALGVADLTLLELTSAYTTFPNAGLHPEPYLIERVEDRNGSVLEAHSPKTTVALRPETAFQMSYLLMGVVQNGTGKRAKKLGRALAGKTGTTDDYTDAWFVGFSPSLAVGTWVGYDQKKPLGKKQTGAEAALPMWIRFFEKALEGTPEERFRKPSNIVFVPVDRLTGKPAGPECAGNETVSEAFPKDRVPQETCGRHDHFRLSLPHCLQRFELDSNLQLIVDTEDEILALEGETGCGIQIRPDGRYVEAWAGQSSWLIPYRVRPAGEARTVGPGFLPEGFVSEGAAVLPVHIGPWADQAGAPR